MVGMTTGKIIFILEYDPNSANFYSRKSTQSPDCLLCICNATIWKKILQGLPMVSVVFIAPNTIVNHFQVVFLRQQQFQFPRKYLNLFGTCLYIQPKRGAINNNWLLRCSGLHFACIPRDTLHTHIGICWLREIGFVTFTTPLGKGTQLILLRYTEFRAVNHLYFSPIISKENMSRQFDAEVRAIAPMAQNSVQIDYKYQLRFW